MAGSIYIDITDIYDNTTHFVITRDRRKGLTVENHIPGGNDVANWQIPCDLGAEWKTKYGKWPSLGSHVDIHDGNDIFWQGRWNQPKLQVKKRILTQISCTAQGYMHSLIDNSMETRVVYGKGVTGVQIGDDKRNITDITEGVADAVAALCPFVVVPAITPCGINVNMDTQAFAGSTAQDIVNFFAALTSFLGTPFVWYIIPGPGDVPSFYFQAMNTGLYYKDDGQAEWDTQYDLEKIVNKVTAEWGNNQRWTEPDDSGSPTITGPLAYHLSGGTDIVKRKYLNAAEQYTSFDDIKALAGGYLNRFNTLVGAGNYVIREGPIHIVGPSTEELHIIMPNHTIQLQLPDDYPEPTDTDRYVTHTVWSEDDCTTTLTMANPNTIASEMQRLVYSPENQKFLASMSFGDVQQPTRLGNEAPSIGLGYPDGTQYDDVGGGRVVVRTVVPMAAMTTTGSTSGGTYNKDFGDQGGQLLPGILPDNFAEVIVPIRTADGTPIPVAPTTPIIVLPITKDYHQLQTYMLASVQAGGWQVKFQKNGVDVVTCTQAAGNSSPLTAFTPFDLAAGDVLSVFVTGNAGGIANGSVTLSADKKHWPKFPTAYPPKV